MNEIMEVTVSSEVDMENKTGDIVESKPKSRKKSLHRVARKREHHDEEKKRGEASVEVAQAAMPTGSTSISNGI